MKRRNKLLLFLSIIVCFALLFSQYAVAATVTYKTQKEYDSADIAWLKDLVIKESMNLSSDVTKQVALTPKTEYPYAQTPEGFRNEVAHYCEIYSLSENAPRAAYVYIFELLGANPSLLAGQTTDEAVRDYLQNAGVVLPAVLDTDDTVLARALYAAMITGAFSGLSSEELGKGVAFEKALVKYLISFSGMSETELLKWAPQTGISTFDDYVLAASRLSLWMNGFDVSADTPEGEVYRLTAVLTLRKMGVNVGTDASFESLKAKYTAALLGKAYGVTVAADKLSEARAAGSEAFYMLQLLGKKANLNVSAELSYEEAFRLVAEKTDVFALEEGAFYADIYEYEAQLQSKRDSVWIYPTAYVTGMESADVTISVNGTYVQNNVFTQISLHPDRSAETLEIVVRASGNGKSSSCTYVITLLQGSNKPQPSGSGAESSESIISRIFSSFGMDSSVSELMSGIYSTLPGSVKNVLSFIAPTFISDTDPADQLEPQTPAEPVTGEPGTTEAPQETVQTRLQNSYFVGALDKIGQMIDFVISGISGVQLSDRYESRTVDHNFITFD